MTPATVARSILFQAVALLAGYGFGRTNSRHIDWSIVGLASIVLLGVEALISLKLGGARRREKAELCSFGVLGMFVVMLCDLPWIALLPSLWLMSRLNTERSWCGLIGAGIFTASIMGILVTNASNTRWGTGFSGTWME